MIARRNNPQHRSTRVCHDEATDLAGEDADSLNDVSWSVYAGSVGCGSGGDEWLAWRELNAEAQALLHGLGLFPAHGKNDTGRW